METGYKVAKRAFDELTDIQVRTQLHYYDYE